jgi:hypothetical protein
VILEWKAYQAAENAEAAMKERFMNHTQRFLAKHGIILVGVFTSPDDPKMLYYLTQFDTDEQRRASWKAFQGDPEWQALRKETEVNGPLVAVQSTIILHPAK